MRAKLGTAHCSSGAITTERRPKLGVIPAKAGTHPSTCAGCELGPCFRRDDTEFGALTGGNFAIRGRIGAMGTP
jgi:hypothetical protein